MCEEVGRDPYDRQSRQSECGSDMLNIAKSLLRANFLRTKVQRKLKSLLHSIF